MTKKRETHAQILERVRGERDLSITDFVLELDVMSRQWYHRILKGGEVDLKTLCFMAVDCAGEWRGELAVELIGTVDKRFVPCVCETEIGDAGICPKHYEQGQRPTPNGNGVRDPRRTEQE